MLDRACRAASMAAVLILLAACGSSTSSTESGAGSSSSASSSSSSSQSRAASAAALFNGHYSGSWTNQTFNTTGAFNVDVAIDANSGAVTMTLTLGGNVFGAPAPGPQTFTGQIPPSGDVTLSGSNAFFGPYTGTIKTDGSFSVTCSAVPNQFIKTATVTGKLTPQGADGTYTLNGVNNTTAHGVISVKKG